MERKSEPVNPFYWLLVAAGTAMIVTILALLTSLLTLDPLAGEEQLGMAPPARFLNQWGGTLVFAETGVLVVASVLAMVLDRVRSRRQERE